jgi:ATP-binding cassette subfamily B protein
MSFGILFLGGALIQSVCVYYYCRCAGHMEMDTAYELRQNCFRQLQSLSFSYFDVTPIGWLMARMTSDISRLAEILAWSLMDLAWGLSVMIGVTVVMLMTNWKLALLVLAVVPFLAWASNWFQIRILKNYRDVRKINSRITNGFNEGISGAKTTKTLGLEETSTSRNSTRRLQQMRDASIRSVRLSALFYPVVMIAVRFLHGSHSGIRRQQGAAGRASVRHPDDVHAVCAAVL